MEVVGLESCAEARAHTADGPPALVVADVDLPDDGLEIIETLTRLHAPVILMTTQPARFEAAVSDSRVEVLERIPLPALRDHVLRTLEGKLWEGLYARHGVPEPAQVPAKDEVVVNQSDTVELLLDEILASPTPVSPPADDDFEGLMEQAFEALVANDRPKAWTALQAARALRPDHGLVKANLARLNALGLD
ncbi:MAG: hypothetical protein H6706_00835 [Myxococcales bacterium]|nr:hypothetical protein [Myxococcales bacterium]